MPRNIPRRATAASISQQELDILHPATTQIRVNRDMLIVPQLVNQFPAPHLNQIIITLSRPIVPLVGQIIQPTPSHSIFNIPFNIIPIYAHVLQVVSFLQVSTTQTQYAFLLSPMHSRCPTYIIFIDHPNKVWSEVQTIKLQLCGIF